MVFNIKNSLSATLALLLAFSPCVHGLATGNYTITTTSEPPEIIGTFIQATPASSTISNLNDYRKWPVEWYQWYIQKLLDDDTSSNYTMMLNGEYSEKGANDVYLVEYASYLEAQVWVLEPSYNGSNQYRILSPDGTLKWAFPAEDFPVAVIQIQPIPVDSNKFPGLGPAADLFTFTPM